MNDNYTIKEGYDLPSKGLIYSKPVKSHVELRSMTTRDEMRRTSPSNTPYKNLAELIESCMIEKPAIHVYDMCLGDYEYLLHKLRVVTYGSSYKMAVGCPHCGNVFDMTVDLDTLEVKKFSKEEFENALIVELPVSGHRITLKYQTPRILDEIELRSKELSKKAKGGDYRAVVSLQLAIDTVDGNKLSVMDLEEFVYNLPQRDSNKILNTLTKLNKMVGLDTEIVTKCTSCGGEILTFFRFGPEFFRPSED